MLSSIFCKTMCASINFKTATTRPCGPFFACSSAELPFQVFQSCFENVFSIAGMWVSVFLLFLQQHQQQQAIARMFQTPTKTEPKRHFFLLRSTTIVSLLILSTQQGYEKLSQPQTGNHKIFIFSKNYHYGFHKYYQKIITLN